MAQLIKADGTTTEVVPSNGKKFTLEELQRHVGGYIQMLAGREKKTLFVDEEGLLKQLPINMTATVMLDPLYQGQVLCGNVLVCSRERGKKEF